MPEPINPAMLGERCRCLRSKEMFIDAEPDPRLPSMGSGIFWCIHTHNCLGPDGKVAEPAGRGHGWVMSELWSELAVVVEAPATELFEISVTRPRNVVSGKASI